jgi:dipeptidyl aminopeptidase/acylaminoacyl peptidase
MKRWMWVWLAGVLPLGAEFPALERLFTRPYLWGTSPSRMEWARKGHTLGFLWNAEGRRFLDLYAYHPGARRLVRLTDLESFEDDLVKTAEEKDSRRKQYVMPPAGIDAFDLSDDGSQAAFTYRGELWLVRTDGSDAPRRLTRTKARESSPRFLPDGERLAFVRDGQVHILNLKTAQLWQVTDVEESEGTVFAWAPSPDGRQFAVLVRRTKPRQQILPNYSGEFVKAEPFPRGVAGDEPLSYALELVPAEGGKARPVKMGTLGEKVWPSMPKWSEDSKSLLVRVVDGAMKKQQIVAIDPTRAESKVLFEEEDPAWVYWSECGWSPDGRWVWFLSEKDGWAHLYKVPSEGGEPVQLTKGNYELNPDRIAEEPQWTGGWIYFTSTEDGPSERHFYRIRPDGSGKEKLSSQPGLNSGRVTWDGRHTYLLMADLNNPFDLWVDGHRVTQSPQPEFYKQDWPETVFVQFPSRGDRKTVHAKMLLPRGYRPGERTGKKWPCVFFIHGAGYATSVLKQWGSYHEVRFAFNAWLANQGYVVMDLDYRGSSGYGRDWRTDVYLHLGGKDLDDVLGAVDYVNALGNIDSGKLGIWGVSYGGFMTNMAMFLAPDTFRAGSSWAAVNDWENYNPYYTTQRFNTPQKNPEAYRRSSPITFSGGLKNHLLIVHGMVDSNVLFQDAVQLTEKLIAEGKEFAHIYYPQEDHGFVRDETWRDAFRRTAEWFERHLK